MTITIDWASKLVLSDASITDIVTFKETIREFEDDAEGMLHDPIIAYKRVDLGGGAYFHDVPFINGYQLKFPNPGNYTVIGNIGATIVPVAGVFVDRTKSAAFSTTSSAGGGGASAEETANAVWASASRTLTTPFPAIPTPPTAEQNATAVWAKALEGLSAEEMMRIMLAALAGKREGLGTSTEKYMGQDGVTPRITLSADQNGNGVPVLNGAA